MNDDLKRMEIYNIIAPEFVNLIPKLTNLKKVVIKDFMNHITAPMNIE